MTGTRIHLTRLVGQHKRTDDVNITSKQPFLYPAISFHLAKL